METISLFPLCRGVVRLLLPRLPWTRGRRDSQPAITSLRPPIPITISGRRDEVFPNNPHPMCHSYTPISVNVSCLARSHSFKSVR